MDDSASSGHMIACSQQERNETSSNGSNARNHGVSAAIKEGLWGSVRCRRVSAGDGAVASAADKLKVGAGKSGGV